MCDPVTALVIGTAATVYSVTQQPSMPEIKPIPAAPTQQAGQGTASAAAAVSDAQRRASVGMNKNSTVLFGNNGGMEMSGGIGGLTGGILNTDIRRNTLGGK